MTDGVLDVGGGIASPADESLSRAVGLHHTLTTALADLVDNSVDAGAMNVLIRFVQDGTRIVGLKVIDNGKGMDTVTVDAAMTYGKRRSYGVDDLGHFGVGMKAASMSQAEQLFVWSRSSTDELQGRMIEGSSTQSVHSVGPVETTEAFASTHPRFPFPTGTIVEWRGIRSFLMSADSDEQVSWLETTIDDVRSHLGIVFHRLLGTRLAITLDVFDVGFDRAGALRTVKAIDPFAYGSPATSDYPAELSVGHGTKAIAHLWPARSSAGEFRLFGAPGRDRQGLYFYRNDRLLQIGGWNGLWHSRPDYGLSRIAIDLDGEFGRHVTINPEKAGVVLDATAVDRLQRAIRDSPNGKDVLADAVAAVKAARSHSPKPISVVEPHRGLPEDVLDTFSDAFTFVDTADPVSTGWRVLARDAFFEVDLKTRTLWINARFRRDLLGRKSIDNTDAPVMRTLVYLLVQNMFDVHHHSAKQLEQMRAWQDVLVSAMSSHRDQLEARR